MRGRTRTVENQTFDAQHTLYRGALKLQDERLDIPRRRPNLFRFNEWIVNTEGSTVFIPVSDVTRQCISAMLLYFDRPHGYYLVDRQLGNDPLRPFVKSGLLDDTHPVDFWDFERWQMVDMNGVEEGLMIQNLMLATQALGIGGHPFSGGKGRVTLGGEPHWHAIGGEGSCGSLGFEFHRVPEDAPVGAGEEIPVGLPGVFEGACPPFHSGHGRRGRLRRRATLRDRRHLLVARATPDPLEVGRRRARGAAALRGGGRGDEDDVQLHLGHLRALSGDDRPVPDDRLVPGLPPGRRLLRPVLPGRGASGPRTRAHARLARRVAPAPAVGTALSAMTSHYDEATKGPHSVLELGDVLLESGETLRDARLLYKTHGEPNAARDNAILYPHMYSGTPSSLESTIAPGRALDPERYFVICPGQLGGGFSSSPSNTAGSVPGGHGR